MDNLLKSIVECCSVPGNETQLRDLLIKEFEPFGTIIKTKWTGFYCDYKGNTHDNKRKKIVITAHMDSPGFIVKDINPDGTLSLISLGGISPSRMDIRSVSLYTNKKSFPGVLTRQCDNSDHRDASYKGFFGFSSQENAEKLGVQKGDSVCFHSPILELQNKFIAAPHLDNRLGIFLLVDIAKKLPKNLDCDVYFAVTSCEEMGGRCAKILANMIQPDIAICLDATYAEGSVEMGKGPVVTLSDAAVLLPTKIRDELGKIAKSNKIPLQYEVYNYAGTDAKDFRDAPGGCLTISLLIATLNNHSPHEVCCLEDINYTCKFILAMLKNHKNLVV